MKVVWLLNHLPGNAPRRINRQQSGVSGTITGSAPPRHLFYSREDCAGGVGYWVDPLFRGSCQVFVRESAVYAACHCHSGIGTWIVSPQPHNFALTNIGSLSMGVILTALESCNYPFQLPALIDRRMVVCRVSDFGDDMDALERSVSKLSFLDTEKELPKKPSHEIPRKPVPPPKPARQPVPGEWPEQPITPLLPPKGARSRGWGEEWTPRDAGVKKGITRHDSAISLMTAGSGRSSSGYTRSSTSIGRVDSGYSGFSDQKSIRKSAALQRPRARNATPSSSIGNLSRRSPLSTMM